VPVAGMAGTLELRCVLVAARIVGVRDGPVLRRVAGDDLRGQPVVVIVLIGDIAPIDQAALCHAGQP
jgi:hypothetical protein